MLKEEQFSTWIFVSLSLEKPSGPVMGSGCLSPKREVGLNDLQHARLLTGWRQKSQTPRNQMIGPCGEMETSNKLSWKVILLYSTRLTTLFSPN